MRGRRYPFHSQHGRYPDTLPASNRLQPTAERRPRAAGRDRPAGFRARGLQPDPCSSTAFPSTAGLKLSLERLLERDELVYSFLKAREIPGASVMAGGYRRNTWALYTQFLESVLLSAWAGRWPVRLVP